MSTLARQYNLDGHYGAFQPLAEDESTHTWPPVAEAFPAAQPEEEDDDIDLYYFSTDSDSSMGDISREASVHDDVEVEEEIMPGGWPAAIESRISSPTPWKPSLVRPQSIIVDGLRITVTLPEDESCDYEDGHCLVGSDSAASFFTAAESIIDDIHLLSASPTSDFLHVPIPVLAPSPSVLFILEEFACSPPLPALSFDDDGEANLMAMSSSPSVGLLKPTKNDLLVPGVVPSPEFASNFAQARFPELVCPSFLAPIPASPSHYPWFDSLLDVSTILRTFEWVLTLQYSNTCPTRSSPTVQYRMRHTNSMARLRKFTVMNRYPITMCVSLRLSCQYTDFDQHSGHRHFRFARVSSRIIRGSLAGRTSWYLHRSPTSAWAPRMAAVRAGAGSGFR